MIFYGWRTFVKALCNAGAGRCENCGNDVTWQLVRRRSWFTLFFIPIIPYRTEYLVTCPVCHAGLKVTKQQAQQIRQQQADAYAAGRIG